MKKSILTIILLILLSVGRGLASDIPGFPFVNVTGEAEQEVSPDIARIGFEVLLFDEDPVKALFSMEKRSDELMTLFKKFGIENKDVVAYEINKRTLRQEKDYVELKILGYELTRQVMVTIHHLDKFDALMTQLIELKNVTNIQTGFDTKKRKELEAELIKKSAHKARQQADLLAKGFGTEISSVYAITISPNSFADMSDSFTRASYRMFAAPVAAPAPAGVDRKRQDYEFIGTQYN